MKWLPLLFLCAHIGLAQEFSTAQGARLIVGQKTFTDQIPAASDTVIGSPSGVAYGANTLIIADTNRLGATPNNNRLLLYLNAAGFVYNPTDEVPQTNSRCPACIGQASVVLGQPDFATTTPFPTPSATTVRNPNDVAVSITGHFVAAADTDFNRVLIWKGIPTSMNAPADIVLGQKDFASFSPGLSNTQMRGPQGVWFDSSDGLWVADASNNRVLYFGVPTQNGQAATLVLGQKDFNTNPFDISGFNAVPTQNDMLTPVSVTSDGVRLYVADLGFSRILIWNSIPTTNGQNADIVIGQKDFVSSGGNSSKDVCASNGTDSSGNPTYPDLCEKTLSFPRYVLSDGKRLFVSDSGNDRVLIYLTIPTQNAPAADVVLGQVNMTTNDTSDSASPGRISSSDSFRTPAGLAFDGENLYVADVFNRRVLIFTPGTYTLPLTAVKNSASQQVYAVGAVVIGGTILKNDQITITLGGTDYKYTVVDNDTADTIASALVGVINAGVGDPNVLATINAETVVVTAKTPGPGGNAITLAAAVANTNTTVTATTTATASGGNLAGGQDAARIAPFTIVTIQGDNLTDQTASTSPGQILPTELAGVQVYFDGIKSPIYAVSPTQISAQIPVEVNDGTSSNAVVRTVRADGSISVSQALAVPIIAENPGVYSQPGGDPRTGIAMHYSSKATGTVSVDGTAKAGDTASIVIQGRTYTYTVVANDALTNIRDGLVNLINASDPAVEAYPSGSFTRVRLRARIEGPLGNGIPFSVATSTGAQVLMTATNSALCCANQAGALVTTDNPALPGETIVVLATGLGLVMPDDARASMVTGYPYWGPQLNDPVEFVSSLAGGKTANVLYAGLRQGSTGVYEVHLELNGDLPTDMKTQVTIAQSFQVSNIFTVAVLNPSNPQP
jgi:uncharacterized protein (TIGR03437 family)